MKKKRKQTELQAKIYFKVEKNRSSTFTEEELIHAMYLAGPVWIDLVTLEAYPGNNVEIAGRVDSILEIYTSDLMRPILVVVIEDGRYIIADGHHRVALFRKLGMTRIQAYVRNDLKTLADVNDFYLKINRSLAKEKKSSTNEHRNAVTNNEAAHVAVQDIANEFGWQIDGQYLNNSLGAPKGLVKLYVKKGETIYRQTFDFLFKAFDGAAASLTLEFITDVMGFFDEKKNDVDFQENYEEFVKVMSKKSASEWDAIFAPTNRHRVSRDVLRGVYESMTRG